ncbi:carbohydrate sulfotransferase 1-like [Ylistrum balloti]|uniref:carbohydrate sulfotransferase 1-like n=1 Tax=Ylistrum balloti TaxID=509963 RepID=UPI0029059CFF|nr:carbohydrate sulfotransferase 1-like [Ylistrum balloti]
MAICFMVLIAASKCDGNSNSSKFLAPQQLEAEDTGPACVLVLTYMRSGSTMIGDILQHHEGSAYMFEPLRYIEEDIMQGNNVTFLNSTQRLFNKKDTTSILAEMLYRWYKCDVEKINIKDLTSMMLAHSNVFADFYNCFKRAKFNETKYRIKSCLKRFTKPCNSSKVWIIKTIRLEMASVQLLLKWLPRLKVIHLLRDPRARISSQLRLRLNDSLLHAASECNRMLSDIKLAEQLYQQYPQSIRILQYERFTNDSIEKTKSMYQFLNFNFTTQIHDYVKAVTLQRNLSRNCDWCVKRTNSKLASSKWRLTMKYQHVQLIDRQCVSLYKRVGILEIKDSQNLKNLNEKFEKGRQADIEKSAVSPISVLVGKYDGRGR